MRHGVLARAFFQLSMRLQGLGAYGWSFSTLKIPPGAIVDMGGQDTLHRFYLWRFSFDFACAAASLFFFFFQQFFP